MMTQEALVAYICEVGFVPYCPSGVVLAGGTPVAAPNGRTNYGFEIAQVRAGDILLPAYTITIHRSTQGKAENDARQLEELLHIDLGLRVIRHGTVLTVYCS